jgi:hypothetical protein
MATTGTNPDGTTRNRIDQLARAVYFQEAGAKSSLPPSATPKATDSAHADSTTQTDVASRVQLKTDTNTPSETEFFTDAPKGSLNPQFVEWLMGYPKDWTEVQDFASGRKKSQALQESPPESSTEPTV